MSFNILYLEDDDADYEETKAAVETHNLRKKGERLVLTRAQRPEELEDRLSPGVDAVLTDLFFPSKNGDGSRENRLKDILKVVKAWKSSPEGDPSLPVIAVTDTGPATLKRCLRYRSLLYDLWDKNTAEPQYIAWRLSRLAAEVARDRPDALLQRLIRDMPSGASYHKHVVSMARDYSEGWSERDQFERVTIPLVEIGRQIGCGKAAEELWKRVRRWEGLGRAASDTARGHARHVINVFWLGYVLIYSDALKSPFESAWKRVLSRRAEMDPVVDMDPRECLSRAWYLAALFHDSGQCIEKSGALLAQMSELSAIFPKRFQPKREPGYERSRADSKSTKNGGFPAELGRLFEASVMAGKPDHGFMSAFGLLSAVESRQALPLAREAARAMCFHNLVGHVDFPKGALSWEFDCLACLLVYCDQLQTWDRERGDDHFLSANGPERAELVELQARAEPGGPLVHLRIDYIPFRRGLRSASDFGVLKPRLERVIQERPASALAKIEGQWPFRSRVVASLGGRRLDVSLENGF